MLIEDGGVRDLVAGEAVHRVGGRAIHLRGVAYLPGHAAGAPSLAACDWSTLAGTLDAARRLKGTFVLAVGGDGGPRRVFTDAAGAMDAFVADATISTSFLGLCAERGVRFADLDPAAVAELVDLGAVYGRGTLAPQIRRLEPGRVYELRGNGAPPAVHDAGVPGIATPPPPGLSLEAAIAALAGALAGRRVSVDLTGGADSRVLATLLAGPLDAELALTGVPGYADLPLAERVAERLGRPLRVFEHDVGALDTELGDLFEAADGLGDVLRIHRLRRHAHARAARGVEVAISGMGGELYTDYWWLQDLPRYRSARARVERLFDLRMRPVAMPPELLTGPYRAAAAAVRDRRLAELRALVMPLNTQTYDRIYAEQQMRAVAPRITAAGAGLQDLHAPLLDAELVRFGYALPRRRRVLNGVHRQVLTAARPDVARLPTSEGGMSLSAEPLRRAADARRYAADRGRRALSKLRQRRAGTPLAQATPDHPGLVPAARGSAAFASSVARLRGDGILGTGEVPDRWVGRILTLGLLHERLEG